MADNTPIEWTDATWNPVTGCKVVSPGCTNCYAMKDAGRRLKNHPSRKGLTDPSKAGPVWNGKVRFNEDWLTQPLHWKKPRRIFVCAHGDLFHENVPDDWIDRIFAVMAMRTEHTFQLLTKRADRMRDYLTAPDVHERWSEHIRSSPFRPSWIWGVSERWISQARHIWLGVSVEDQQRADERVPLLLDTPAAIRFVSYEPALGPVDFTRIPYSAWALNALTGLNAPLSDDLADLGIEPTLGPRLDWIIVGGESGPGARPFDIAWARSIIKQCKAAGVPVFIKQLGAKPIDWHTHPDSWAVTDKKGGDPAEWPADLRVREFPQTEGAIR